MGKYHICRKKEKRENRVMKNANVPFFQSVETSFKLRMDSKDAMRGNRLLYRMARPPKRCPCNCYEAGRLLQIRQHPHRRSDGEIIVEADGIRILLDRRNIVVYPDSDPPTVYWNILCDVTFTA